MVSAKRIALSLALVSALMFITFMMVFTYQLPPKGTIFEPIFEALTAHHVELMVLMGTFGMVVGAGVFYLMSDKVEQKGSETRAVKDILLKFLGRDDRHVVSELLKRGGRMYQSEIARLPNMTRLKAHRMVVKMEQMGIIEITPSGKMRVVTLKEDLKKALIE